MPDVCAIPVSVDETLRLLQDGDYVAGRGLATMLFLSLRLGRPILLEGDAGVGKTEIANVLACVLGRRLVRLQCYEGLDATAAVYEWNYAAQMIEVRLAQARGDIDRESLAKDVFSERFLIKRPLLQALEPGLAGTPVLLIDEVDRADAPFEAYLLELLSDYQVTVPETGTVVAREPPIVVVTSNRTREVHDALKRRCFYHWIGYPSASRERAILRAKMPDIEKRLGDEIVAFIQELRQTDLSKRPGIGQTLAWASTLVELDRVELDPETVSATLGVLLTRRADATHAGRGVVGDIVEKVKAGAAETPP
jgi:MoxR-like ATPase